MYRKHGDSHVVKIDQVWPLIELSDPDYVAWLGEGNTPIEQDEGVVERAPEAQKAEAPAIAKTTITVAGEAYEVSANDALKVAGAFMQVLSRKEVEVTLESGEILPVSNATVDEISNQLAGGKGS